MAHGDISSKGPDMHMVCQRPRESAFCRRCLPFHRTEIDLCAEISRVIPDKAKTKVGREEDAWGFRKQSALSATGRIFINVWRSMRTEMNLVSYSLENAVFHVLHRR